jgi:aminoglycoside 6'-N-acetyltransferase I
MARLSMQVRQLAPTELHRIAPLRAALWPGSTIEDLAAIMAAQPEYLVLIALEDGEPAGFAEMSLRRDDAIGGGSTAFLEGICVDPAHRRKGIARTLVAKALEWGRKRGISEFASEALLANGASHAFHRAIGFAETERVVCFRRRIAA